MKRNLRLLSFLGFLLIFHSGNVETFGQGVCVISELKVNKITGSVRFMNSESFIKDAKLELVEKNNKTKVISETVTNEKGWFEFEKVKKGKYVLIVSSPKLEGVRNFV